MLIFHRRLRWLFSILIFGCFLILIYKKKSIFTDEHRIYTSLLIDLPHLERLIRLKQTNLSDTQNRLIKIEKTLTKYTWHLNRLIQTINYNQQEAKKIYHFNSFDFDLEKNNLTKFFIYFHSINISNHIDYDILNKFYSNIRSPYITFNENEAFLHVIYLPIRSNKGNICYKDFIEKKYFVLYEFLNEKNEEIDDKCFRGNFLPVKFFNRFEINQTFVNNDHWRINEQQRPSIGIVYLNTNGEFEEN